MSTQSHQPNNPQQDSTSVRQPSATKSRWIKTGDFHIIRDLRPGAYHRSKIKTATYRYNRRDFQQSVDTVHCKKKQC